MKENKLYKKDILAYPVYIGPMQVLPWSNQNNRDFCNFFETKNLRNFQQQPGLKTAMLFHVCLQKPYSTG